MSVFAASPSHARRCAPFFCARPLDTHRELQMGRTVRNQKPKAGKKSRGSKVVLSDELVKACLSCKGFPAQHASCFPSSKTFSIAEDIHAAAAARVPFGATSTKKGVDVGDVYIQLIHSACKRIFEVDALHDTYFFVARMLWLFAWRDRADERRAHRTGTVQCALGILIQLHRWRPSDTAGAGEEECAEFVDNMTPDVKSRLLALCESLGFEDTKHAPSVVLPSRCALPFSKRPAAARTFATLRRRVCCWRVGPRDEARRSGQPCIAQTSERTRRPSRRATNATRKARSSRSAPAPSRRDTIVTVADSIVNTLGNTTPRPSPKP